jgi:flagella basal body P-ring formation protein FlgA
MERRRRLKTERQMKRLYTTIGSGLVLVVACLALNTLVHAGGTHAHASIQRAIEDYLRVQTNGLPGEVTFNVGAIDPRLALSPCGALDVFTPPGTRLWGTSSVGVRCTAPQPWTIYVGVTVRVKGAYLAAARAIAGGQALTQNDLAVMQGDLTQMPAGVVTDPSQAVGKTTAAPLAAGQPLRADLLRTPFAIQQGQMVKVYSSGPGFRVSAEGRALVNASPGQVAQVRGAGGQTVTGVARDDGSVEVRF